MSSYGDIKSCSGEKGSNSVILELSDVEENFFSGGYLLNGNIMYNIISNPSTNSLGYIEVKLKENLNISINDKSPVILIPIDECRKVVKNER